MSVDVLTGVAPTPPSDCSDKTVVGKGDGRVVDVDRNLIGVLTVRASAAGVLLDATSGFNGVAAGIVEEVAAIAEVSGLAAIKGVVDEEDIVTGVEIWMATGMEGISVWFRNRATL